MELTLEQEFTARVFLHKTSILGAVVMQEFMEAQRKGDVLLSDPIIEKMADEYSNKVMQTAVAHGTLDKLYQEAWDKIKFTVPEHLKAI